MKTPTISEWLDNLLILATNNAAHKAQIDYIAVNHPDEIRFGEDPRMLADFIQSNVERVKHEIVAHMLTEKETESTFKDYWHFAGRWHNAGYCFVGDDRGVCNCMEPRKMINEIRSRLYIVSSRARR